LKPPRVEVLIAHRPDTWKVMLFEEPSDDIDLEIIPQEIYGLKVIMLDMD